MRLIERIDKIIKDVHDMHTPFDSVMLEDIDMQIVDILSEIEVKEANLDKEVHLHKDEMEKIDDELHILSQKPTYRESDFLSESLFKYIKNNDKQLKLAFSEMEASLNNDLISPASIVEHLRKIRSIHREMRDFLDDNALSINFLNKEYLDQLEKALELQDKVKNLVLSKEETI